MDCQIVLTAEPYFHSLHRALDRVAREQKYLAFLQAPPFDEALAFYRTVVDNGYVQRLALDGEAVLGWCDVLPVIGDARSHIGVLGIGLVPEARHQGLGARLMETTIAAAWDYGFTRIELDVRCDNHNAKALYERFGFEVEGVKRKAFRVGDSYHDAYYMALLRGA